MGNSQRVYTITDTDILSEFKPWDDPTDPRKYLSPAYYEIERRCLENSGLKYEDFKIDNIIVDTWGNYVRTFQVGMNTDQTLEPKEKLVIIHGFGGSSIMYWPVMKDLAKDFHLILLDQLGMGASSRPEFPFTTAEETIEFFVTWIEKWRVEIGILNDKFILCGHSLGGYLTGMYTKRYPYHIKKLLLLSPFGVPKRNFTDEEFPVFFNSIDRPPSVNKAPMFYFKIAKILWQKRWAPYNLLRKNCYCSSRLHLRQYVRNRIQGGIPLEHKMDYRDFMLYTLLRPASTEYCLYTCFDHFMHPIRSLEEEFKDLNIPTSMVYGDRDYMAFIGNPNKLLDTNVYKGVYSHSYILENADHNLFFDNPEGLVRIIKQDLEYVNDMKLTLPSNIEPLTED